MGRHASGGYLGVQGLIPCLRSLNRVALVCFVTAG